MAAGFISGTTNRSQQQASSLPLCHSSATQQASLAPSHLREPELPQKDSHAACDGEAVACQREGDWLASSRLVLRKLWTNLMRPQFVVAKQRSPHPTRRAMKTATGRTSRLRIHGGFAGNLELLVLITIYAIYFGLVMPIGITVSNRFALPLGFVVLAPLFCCYTLSWTLMLIPSWSKKWNGSSFVLGNQILAICVFIALGFAVLRISIRFLAHVMSLLS